MYFVFSFELAILLFVIFSLGAGIFLQSIFDCKSIIRFIINCVHFKRYNFISLDINNYLSCDIILLKDCI